MSFDILAEAEQAIDLDKTKLSTIVGIPWAKAGFGIVLLACEAGPNGV